MMIIKHGVKSGLLAILVLCISACSGDNSDLSKYINDTKNRPAKPIEPIPKFAPLPVFKFPENDPRRNPFKPTDQRKRAEQAAPDQKRKKQPLEAFPLDALKFVGNLRQGSEVWALIKTPDDKVVPIRVGYYMGQNFGRIIAIKNDQIKLEETIKKDGQWEKQITTLNLDEGK